MPPTVRSGQDGVDASFARLLKTAKSLNQISDSLNFQVESIEKSLKKLNLGVEAWVHFAEGDGDEDGDGSDSLYIGYTRLKSGWGLAVKIATFWRSREPSETVTPLLEVNRPLRTQALKKLPELFENLDKAAVQTAQELLTAGSNVEGLANALAQVTAGEEEPEDALPF